MESDDPAGDDSDDDDGEDSSTSIPATKIIKQNLPAFLAASSAPKFSQTLAATEKARWIGEAGEGG